MRQAPLWRRYDRLSGSDPGADVKDELRFHLESKVDDLVARGLVAMDGEFGQSARFRRTGAA